MPRHNHKNEVYLLDFSNANHRLQIQSLFTIIYNFMTYNIGKRSDTKREARHSSNYFVSQITLFCEAEKMHNCYFFHKIYRHYFTSIKMNLQ